MRRQNKIIGLLFSIFFVKTHCDVYSSTSFIKKCDDNQWFDPIQQQCNSCKANCNKCYDQTCVECKYGLNAEGNSCLDQETCQKDEYFEQQNKICRKCQIPFCKKCINQSQCGECSQDFQLINQKCYRNEFLSDDPIVQQTYQNKKIYQNQSGQVQFIDTCPLIYYEDSEIRTCQSMSFKMNNVRGSQNLSSDNQYTKILHYLQQDQLILINDYEINIYQRNQLDIQKQILNLRSQQSESSQFTQQKIQQGFLYVNILFVFTNQQLLAYDLRNMQLVYALGFSSGEYKFNYNQRMFLDFQKNRINFLHYDKDNNDLYLSIFQIHSDYNGGIVNNLTVTQLASILMNIQIKNIFSISYISSQRYIVITSEEQVFIILESELVSDENIKSQEWKQNFSKFFIQSKLNASATLQQDEVESDFDGIYILRQQLKSFNLIQLNIWKDQNNVKSIKTLNSQYERQDTAKYEKYGKLLRSNSSHNNNQLILIVHTKNYYNFEYLYQIEINPVEYCFDNRLLTLNKKYQTQEQLFSQDIEFQYLIDPSNGQQVLLYDIKDKLGIIYIEEIADKKALIKISYENKTKFQQFHLQDMIIFFEKDIESDFQIYTPYYYQSILSLKFKNSSVKIEHSQQHTQQLKDELYFSQNLLQAFEKQITSVYLDEKAQILFYYEQLTIVKDSKVMIFIYQIDLLRNEVVSFQSLNYLQQSQGIKKVNMYQIEQMLVIVREDDGIYLIEYFSLSIIKYFQCLPVHFYHSIKYIPFIARVNDLVYFAKIENTDIQVIYYFQDKIDLLYNIVEQNEFVIISYFNKIGEFYYIDIAYQLELIGQIKIEKDPTVYYQPEISFQFLNDKEFFISYKVKYWKILRFKLELDQKQHYIASLVQEYDYIEANGHPQQYIYQPPLLIQDPSFEILLFKAADNDQYFNTKFQLFDIKNFVLMNQIEIELTYSEDYIDEVFGIAYDRFFKLLSINFSRRLFINNKIPFDYFSYSYLFDENSKKFILNQNRIKYESNNIYAFDQPPFDQYIMNQFIDGLTVTSHQLNYIQILQIQQESSMTILLKQNMITTQKASSEETFNMVYNNGKYTNVILNVPSLHNQINSQQPQQKMIDKWYYSQSLESLIQAEIIFSPPFLSKQIVFLSIDNLEQIFNKIPCSIRSQVFWFENDKYLVILFQNNILSYHIQNGQVEQYFNYPVNDQINLEDPTYICIQSKLQSILICSNLGIYNVKTQKLLEDGSFKFDYFSIQNFSLIENSKYILFGENKIYKVQDDVIDTIDQSVVESIKYIQLSQVVLDQAFYSQLEYDCTIYSLPEFYIVYQTQNGNLGYEDKTMICSFNPDQGLLLVYSSMVFKSYQLPFSLTQKSIKQNFSINIEVTEKNYFNRQCQSIRNFFIGQMQIQDQEFKQIRNFLVIDTIEQTKKVYNAFITTKEPVTIWNYWPEKKLLITTKGILSLTDVPLSLKYQGSIQFIQKMSEWSQNYNYVFQQSPDMTSLLVTDISQLFPITQTNSLMQNRFKYPNNNVFEILQNPDLNSIHNRITYYDYGNNQIIQKDHFISLIENSDQIINESFKQQTILSLNDVKYDKSYNSLIQFQLFTIKNQADSINSTYMFALKCKLLLFQNINNQQIILDELDLKKYNCKVWGGQSSAYGYSYQQHYTDEPIKSDQIDEYFLIEANQIIYNIIVKDNKISLQLISTADAKNGYNILDLKIWRDQQLLLAQPSTLYLFVLYQQRTDQFDLIKIANSQISTIRVSISNQYISSINMLYIPDDTFLLVGTNLNLKVYQIKYNVNKYEAQEVGSFDINFRRSINNILISSFNKQPNIYFNLIITSQSRISLLSLDNDFGSFDTFQVQIKVENLIHTRQACQVKILIKNQILAVFDRLQAMIYFLNLNLIGRIEEIENFYIKNILMASDGQTIIVTDLDAIFIYDIRIKSKSNKLSLQQKISSSNPVIYFISNFYQQINEQNNINKTPPQQLLLLFGYDLNGSIYEIYYPKQNQSSEQNTNINPTKNIISINLPKVQQQQEELYKNIIFEEQGFETADESNLIQVKYVYFTTLEDMSILLPTNLIGIGIQYQSKKIDLRIDLNGKVCDLRQYQLDQNMNYLYSLQIQNGKILLGQDIIFQNLNKLILSDVKLQFTSNSYKLQVMNSSQVLFKQLQLSREYILDNERMLRLSNNELYMSYSPLITLKNTKDVILLNTQIRNVKYEKDIFLISNCEKVNINNLQVIRSQISGSIFIILDKTKNIQIENINMLDSTTLQLFSIYQAENVSVKTIKLKTVSQFGDSSLKFVNQQDNLSSSQTLKENGVNRILEQAAQNNIFLLSTQNYYGSFIVVQLVSKSALFENIYIKMQSKLNSFIEYQNFYQYIESSVASSLQYQSQSNKKSIVNISYNSQLTILDLNIQDSQFKKFAVQLIETKIKLNGIRVSSSNNPSILIENTRMGLDLQNIIFQANKFDYLPIIKITNSVLYCQTMILSQNQLLGLDNNVSSIEVLQSDYFFQNIQGDKNKFDSSLIFILETLNKNKGMPSYNENFITQKDLYTLANLKISNNYMRALHIQNQEQLKILHSSFLDNNLDKIIPQGGAIQLIRVKKSELTETLILNNYAIIYGGGIYLENSDLILTQCIIENNEALMGGGVRYSFSNSKIIPSFLKDKIQKQQIQNNKAAIFGKNYGSYPKSLKISSDLKQISSSVNQQSFSVIFKLYGEDGEIATFNEEDYSKEYHKKYIEDILNYQKFYLVPINQSVLVQQRNQDSGYNNQVFNLTAFIAPSNYQELKQASSSGQLSEIEGFLQSKQYYTVQIQSIPWGNLQNDNLLQKFTLQHNFDLTFKQCEEGEVIQQIYDQYYYCFFCQDNTYSLGNPYLKLKNPEQNSCKQCPLGSIYCKGSVIIAQEEYWNDPGSSYVAYCSNSPSKCTQQYSSRNKARKDNEIDLKAIVETSNGCSEGGYGPLCESCDYEGLFWNDDSGPLTFAKRNHYECRKCGSMGDNLNQYILPSCLIFLFLTYVTYQIFSNAYHKINKLKAYLLRCSSLIIISRSLSDSEKTSIILKIIVSYIQIVSIIQQFNLSFPEVLKKLAFFIGDVLDISFYYLDCMFIDLNLNKNIKMIYLRLIWTIISPILYFLLLLLIGYYLQKKLHLVKRKRNLLISGILQFYYMVYPGLIKQSIGTIWCKSINGKSYTLLDAQYECSGDDYIYFNIFLSIPLFLLTVLIPFFIYRQIKKNKFKLMSVSVQLNYGFFYGEYKQESFFWEIIRIYHKIFVFCVISIFNQSNTISGIIVSLSIVFYMKTLQILKPYQINEFNRLELLSQLTAVFTIFCAIMNTHSTSLPLAYIALSIIIILNAFLFIKCMINLSQFAINHKTCPNLATVMDKLSKKYPSIFQQRDTRVINIKRVTKNWKLVQSVVKLYKSGYTKPTSNEQDIELATNQITNNLLLSSGLKKQKIIAKEIPLETNRELLDLMSPKSDMIPMTDQHLIDENIINSPQPFLSPIGKFQSEEEYLNQNENKPTINPTQIVLQTDENNFEEQINNIVINETKEIQILDEDKKRNLKRKEDN